MHDPNHVIDWNVIQVDLEGYFQVYLVHILDRKFKVLWNQAIILVKVQWTCYGREDATWMHGTTMQEEYPQFFVNFKGN